MHSPKVNMVKGVVSSGGSFEFLSNKHKCIPLRNQLYTKSIFLMVSFLFDIYLCTHGSIQVHWFSQKASQSVVHTDGRRSWKQSNIFAWHTLRHTPVCSQHCACIRLCLYTGFVSQARTCRHSSVWRRDKTSIPTAYTRTQRPTRTAWGRASFSKVSF